MAEAGNQSSGLMLSFPEKDFFVKGTFCEKSLPLQDIPHENRDTGDVFCKRDVRAEKASISSLSKRLCQISGDRGSSSVIVHMQKCLIHIKILHSLRETVANQFCITFCGAKEAEEERRPFFFRCLL